MAVSPIRHYARYTPVNYHVRLLHKIVWATQQLHPYTAVKPYKITCQLNSRSPTVTIVGAGVKINIGDNPGFYVVICVSQSCMLKTWTTRMKINQSEIKVIFFNQYFGGKGSIQPHVLMWMCTLLCSFLWLTNLFMFETKHCHFCEQGHYFHIKLKVQDFLLQNIQYDDMIKICLISSIIIIHIYYYTISLLRDYLSLDIRIQ